ncbi:MAG: hypothetical protein ACPGID_14035, partial [Rubricella sp.]
GMIWLKEISLTIAITCVLSTFMVTLGVAAIPRIADPVADTVNRAAHDAAVVESQFIRQVTGFCEPSLERAITVDLATGRTFTGMC